MRVTFMIHNHNVYHSMYTTIYNEYNKYAVIHSCSNNTQIIYPEIYSLKNDFHVYERLYNEYHIHATMHTLFTNIIIVNHKHSKLHQNE